MNAGWLKAQLADVPDNCEVILCIDDYPAVASGIAWKVVKPGAGAQDRQVEIYGK